MKALVAAALVWVLLVWALLAGGPALAQITGTVRVASGLAGPTYVVAPEDDFARLFVLELGGNILLLDLVTGTIDPTPFLTITVSGEGLQGLAFHPNYELNGYFYVYYIAALPRRSVVERYSRDPLDPDLADPASGQTVLEIPQPFDNHNGGWIGFGPDGYLHVPLGDGGSGCDPDNNGQDLDTLLSSVLRIDVDGDDFPADPDRNYAIPSDNPFVGQPGLDEIWSYGLRNPFRSSFDRLTGGFYIADVGQSAREEIDFQPATSTGGENWGWDLREGLIEAPTGGFCAGGPRPSDNVDPIYDYGHGNGASQGNSVTGGYVYRGPGADPDGWYFFGDYVNQRIWSIDAVTGANFTDWTAAFVPDVGEISSIVGFGEDGAGYLYIVDLGIDPKDPGGEIFRVVGDFPFVPCPDLVLSNDAVMGDEVVEHCRNIALGPAYTVGKGGDLTLRAGNRVTLANDASVASGGTLAVEFDPALQLIAP